MQEPCIIEDCDRPRFGHGLCQKHYHRKRRTGTTDGPQPVAYSQPCMVLDCENLIGERGAKGMCPTHYQRVRATGSPARVSPPPRPKCAKEGCSRPATAGKEECTTCRHNRVRAAKAAALRAELVASGTVVRRRRGEGGLTQGGYWEAVCPPEFASMSTAHGRVLEHRLVMARTLGRALLPTETVHHVDGDIRNNTAENLELRMGAHGKHQRVEDVTAAAIEHLRRYAPQVLRD